jgi:glyoxylase-like metal-dependent hydrolase (beta-lactamase superfamily II)
VIDRYEGDGIIKDGVRVVRTGGHTGQHQIVYIESAGKTAVFVADLIPTSAHIQDPWVMGYDLFPMDTLAFKRVREAIGAMLILFGTTRGCRSSWTGRRTVERCCERGVRHP